MEIEKQREDLKYYEYDRPYRIKMHRSEKEWDEGNVLFLNSDVVILGVNMPLQLRERLKKERLRSCIEKESLKSLPLLTSICETWHIL